MLHIYKVEYELEGFGCVMAVVANDEEHAIEVSNLRQSAIEVSIALLGDASESVGCGVVCTEEP